MHGLIMFWHEKYLRWDDKITLDKPGWARSDARMSTYRVLADGTIETDDERAALRISKLMASQQAPGPARGPGRPPKNGRTLAQAKAENEVAATIAFLKALREGGVLRRQSMVSALGVKAPRGIGGALVTVRRVLAEHGFQDFKEVVRMLGQRGMRRWAPGGRIGEAIVALTAKEGSG